RIHWRLLRRGHTVAHGVARAQHGRLQLRLSNLGHLRRGRYTLRIAGRRAGTRIVIRVGRKSDFPRKRKAAPRAAFRGSSREDETAFEPNVRSTDPDAPR